MKVCIIGAGAIGGFIGARLAASGQGEVAALARGATLEALRAHGWRLREDGRTITAPVVAAEDSRALGTQDLVVIAVKGPAMAEVARAIGPLLGPDTVVLPAMNGIPWWFADGVPGLGAEPLQSVDPGGAIAAAIPSRQVLGCVVYAAVTNAEPGLAVHATGRSLIIGEPDGQDSIRLHRVGELLAGAGFEVTRSANIREDIWYKLWGNLTINPVSALTGATIDRILDDPLVRGFCSAAMEEAAEIGARIGCAIEDSPEDRLADARTLGAFKTSMLQDVEAGRPLELDGIVTVVSEIGRRLGIDCPQIDALLGLTRLLARTRGLYPAPTDAAPVHDGAAAG